MNKLRHSVLWGGIVLIILLVFLSLYSAFLGSDGAHILFNSLPLSVYWSVLSLMLIIGIVIFRRLVRVPQLLLIHLGCLLVLVGAMSGSDIGGRLQKKLFGIDKIRMGQMLLYRSQESNKVKVAGKDKIQELPFSIRLNDFRIYYYEPRYLHIQTNDGNKWKFAAELNTEFDLGDEFGSVIILRQFRNFKITPAGEVTDSNGPGCNPALEVQIKYPDGNTVTRYVFESFGGHRHPEDEFLLSWRGVVRDYVSSLSIVKNGETVLEKDVEVNSPLHYGGYYFYQHSYDSQAGQYSILMVTSDTGLSLVYIGYLMLCVGVIWHFWLRYLFRKIKDIKSPE